MPEDKKEQNKKDIKPKKFDIKFKSLDIDKHEYQEIVLSNSNNPEQSYYRQNYYD